MRKFKILIYLLIGLIFISCSNINYVLNSYAEIHIRGQDKCIQIIKISQNGECLLIKGISDQLYPEDLNKIDKIYYKKEFEINSEDHKSKILNEIIKINNKKTFRGYFLLDGQRFEMYINGRKKIDSYGSQSSDLNTILLNIHNYLPEKLSYACEIK